MKQQYALVLLWSIAAVGCTPAQEPRDVDQTAIVEAIGHEIDGETAIEVVNTLVSPEDEPVAFCCGHASCRCDSDPDCIALWLTFKCNTSIEQGFCEKKADVPCSNTDCICPSD